MKDLIAKGLVDMREEDHPPPKRHLYHPDRPALHMLHGYHAHVKQDPGVSHLDGKDVQATVVKLFDAALHETILLHFSDSTMTEIAMAACKCGFPAEQWDPPPIGDCILWVVINQVSTMMRVY
jgi:hypothetical protein